jgi:hypothetical protein
MRKNLPRKERNTENLPFSKTTFNLKKIYKIYRYLDISLEILKLAIVILNGN